MDSIHSLIAILRPLLTTIEAAGGRPLIVGGAVRDALLGLPAKDVDVEVYGLPLDRLVAAMMPFGRVDAVGRSFGVLKLRAPDGREVDVALPQRRSYNLTGERGVLVEPDASMTPREAAARRDFTWNAIAVTPDGVVFDFFDGQNDLRRGVIRHTSEAFGEDPLRVLRAMQFAARFDMHLAPETAAVCRTLLPSAAALPIERVWGEWWKWAAGKRPAAGLRVLVETGWIALYPELVALIGCPQDPQWHPEGDVFVHTLRACDAAATIAERDGLDREARSVLLFATLCHDLGKPATTTQDPDGRIRSIGHAEAGVEPAETLLHRLGSPRNLAAPILPLVREHMAHLGMTVTPRSVRRLAVRLTPATIGMWGRLVEADSAGRPPLAPEQPGAAVVELAAQLGVVDARPAPLVLGRHLVAAGVAPGPRIGQLVRRAYQAQLDGVFSTPEEGLTWLQLV
jgi:tRNA nucleotidyltransferase (CCA-adding enzyme)